MGKHLGDDGKIDGIAGGVGAVTLDLVDEGEGIVLSGGQVAQGELLFHHQGLQFTGVAAEKEGQMIVPALGVLLLISLQAIGEDAFKGCSSLRISL